MVKNRSFDAEERLKENPDEEYLLQERGKLEAAFEAIAADAVEAKEEAIVETPQLSGEIARDSKCSD